MITTIYKTIKKGRHRDGLFIKPYFGKRTAIVTIYFDETWDYEGDNQLMEQKNKVFGYAFIWHKLFSRRITVSKDPNRSLNNIYYYEYKWFKRKELIIAACEDEISIQITSYSFGYKLGPYFGGKAKAPHNINYKLIIDERL